jgi:hypothetical protein
MNIQQPGSHLDHLVRQTRMNHLQLSQMADVKANMLLTLASVVITLCLRYLTDASLRWIAAVLILFCLLTVILAAYAVMPKTPLKIKRGEQPDVHSPHFNLLFFADFLQLSYEDFEAAMEGVMNDHSRAYQVQLQEVYTSGLFLAKEKYRYIRLAYLTFIVGLAASGLVAVVSGVLR